MFLMPNAQVIPFGGKEPQIAGGVFIASGAQCIGDLTVGAKTSIWFNTVIRGDVHYIRIGARSNIQDNTVVHVTANIAPCSIGDDVTIGHSAVIHGCTIGSRCLIGMGAIVLDDAHIDDDSFVAAGALVTPGKKFPRRSMIIGSPAKAVRELSEDEHSLILLSAEHYMETAAQYMI